MVLYQLEEKLFFSHANCIFVIFFPSFDGKLRKFRTQNSSKKWKNEM